MNVSSFTVVKCYRSLSKYCYGNLLFDCVICYVYLCGLLFIVRCYRFQCLDRTLCDYDFHPYWWFILLRHGLFSINDICLFAPNLCDLYVLTCAVHGKKFKGACPAAVDQIWINTEMFVMIYILCSWSLFRGLVKLEDWNCKLILSTILTR